MIPGIPINVEIKKKFPQPKYSTIKPEGADKNVRARPITEDKSAYCVPEYSFLHKTDK